MPTLLAAVLFIISIIVAFPSIAQGSGNTKTLFINASDNQQVFNVRTGENANANSGAIQIKVAKITISTIINSTKNRKILNISSGRSTTGNIGSLNLY